jgi:MFS family permease
MGALSVIIIPRFVEAVIGPSSEPLAAPAGALLTIPGVLIAILVQPTIGAISDHTRTRLGRRKPYILAGTLLDMVFLAFAAWAFLNGSYWAFMAAVMLLQFSSNFAQGPYQGYVPDLVPTPQVGVASGLLGAAQMAGQLGGPALATLFLVILDQPIGIFLAVAAIELGTMLITVLRVPDRPGPPTDLTLIQRARAAWGTDGSSDGSASGSGSRSPTTWRWCSSGSASSGRRNWPTSKRSKPRTPRLGPWSSPPLSPSRPACGASRCWATSSTGSSCATPTGR